MKRKKIKHVSIEEYNSIMDKLQNRVILFRPPMENELIGLKVFVINKFSKLHLIYDQMKTKGKDIVEIIVDKNDVLNGSTTTGMSAYMTLQRYFKTPKLHDKDNAPLNAAGIIESNPRKLNARGYAYGYDINSAFSWGMLQDQPDTTKPLGRGKLEANQIGFVEPGIVVLKEGLYCDYRFPLIESPYKKFVEKYYNLKKNAKTVEERQKAKDILNLCIGYLQRNNCFVRVNIIERCNERIRKLINKYKKNFLYCNTDSFVSDCRIPELDNDLSDGVGSWKLEKEGLFVVNESGYQWGLNTPSIRGQAKAWFNEGFDITTDKLDRSQELNKYVLDKITGRLELK